MKLSNSAINKIGDIIRKKEAGKEYDEALATLNTWRESHGRTLDEFYDKCVELSEQIDKQNIIVAQRLKRLPTIIGKLNRYRTMRLSSMQDIAGVRIIVSDMEQLKLIEAHIQTWEGLSRVSDYIKKPKSSGYRGRHFIFKKDKMFVEIQLRTQLQHLWATTVETTDIFRGSSLKEKNDNTCWHDFFCQVSSIFAISEMTTPVWIYRKLGLEEICNLLAVNLVKNQIHTQITSFAVTEPIILNKVVESAYYAVISLDLNKREAHVTSYKEDEYHLAFSNYIKMERRKSDDKQAVLVAVSQIKKIHEAYPNYFMDLGAFLNIIKFILEKSRKK